MNLQRAIEIKKRTGEELLNTDPNEIDEADRLSIEAMKAVNSFRRFPDPCLKAPLPSETKE